jgi:hypothetical protein
MAQVPEGGYVDEISFTLDLGGAQFTLEQVAAFIVERHVAEVRSTWRADGQEIALTDEEMARALLAAREKTRELSLAIPASIAQGVCSEMVADFFERNVATPGGEHAEG